MGCESRREGEAIQPAEEPISPPVNDLTMRRGQGQARLAPLPAPMLRGKEMGGANPREDQRGSAPGWPMADRARAAMGSF